MSGKQRQGSAEPPTTPEGDALLLGLAAAYRAASDAETRFDDGVTAHPPIIQGYLDDRRTVHGRRALAIEQAILAVRADGLAGAMVQVEALCRTVEYIGTIQDPPDELFQACNHAFYSVLNALGRVSGRSTADGLNVLKAATDTTMTDVPRVVALLTDYLADLAEDDQAKKAA
jgi:hypothetical protein